MRVLRDIDDDMYVVSKLVCGRAKSHVYPGHLPACTCTSSFPRDLAQRPGRQNSKIQATARVASCLLQVLWPW